LVLASSVAASAHEYWFESDSFILRLNQTTSVHLYVGEELKMDEERPYQPSKTRSFDLFSPNAKFDMRTMADADKSPLLTFSANIQGTYLLNMERDWSYIKLDAAEFEKYLADEGMAYVIPQRKKLGETDKPGRERYSRFLKTLLQVGDNRTGNIKTRIGTKLEIVPIDNPYTKKIGGTTQFQFWFDERVLADYTIFATNRDGDNVVTQKIVTDKEGKATVKLDRKGLWLIRLVVMKRCQRNCGEADWESYWGALTFGMNSK